VLAVEERWWRDKAARGCRGVARGCGGCELRPEAHPLLELEELTLLNGPSDVLLLRQVLGLVLLHREHHLLGVLFLQLQRHPIRDLLLRLDLRSVVILSFTEEA
jgi:hypothetical protein